MSAAAAKYTSTEGAYAQPGTHPATPPWAIPRPAYEYFQSNANMQSSYYPYSQAYKY